MRSNRRACYKPPKQACSWWVCVKKLILMAGLRGIQPETISGRMPENFNALKEIFEMGVHEELWCDGRGEENLWMCERIHQSCIHQVGIIRLWNAKKINRKQKYESARTWKMWVATSRIIEINLFDLICMIGRENKESAYYSSSSLPL